MPENEYYRDFDFPERFEREKATRIMPDNLQKMGKYTLRMLMLPPKAGPYAGEFLTSVTEVEQHDDFYEVSFVFQTPEHLKAVNADSRFNKAGFMIIPDYRQPQDPASELEIGYFVGSLDPYDIDLALMVAKSRELLGAR